MAPALTAPPGSLRAPAASAAAQSAFRPFLWLLTAFWVYVALSNVMYANNMNASLTSMKVEHVFAPADARLLQHLMLYPLFLFCMWRSLRTGWQPRWRALPLQLGLALLFVVPASPVLMLGEVLTSKWYGMDAHDMGKGWHTWRSSSQARSCPRGSRAPPPSWSRTASASR